MLRNGEAVGKDVSCSKNVTYEKVESNEERILEVIEQERCRYSFCVPGWAEIVACCMYDLAFR